MTKINDFSNRTDFQQPFSFKAEPQSAFKPEHPALVQILTALEQGTNSATRVLMNTRLAKMSLPMRQKLTNTLQNFVGEIRQQIQLENDRRASFGRHYPPQNFPHNRPMSVEEILRNPTYSAPLHQPPPSRSQYFSAPYSSFVPPRPPPTPTSNSRPETTSTPKSENTVPSKSARTELPRLSMRERPDASHIQQLRANGMSDGDLMTLKEDIQGLRGSDGGTEKQDKFDEKYAHMFDSAHEGGVRENDKNYALLISFIVKELRKTASV